MKKQSCCQNLRLSAEDVLDAIISKGDPTFNHSKHRLSRSGICSKVNFTNTHSINSSNGNKQTKKNAKKQRPRRLVFSSGNVQKYLNLLHEEKNTDHCLGGVNSHSKRKPASRYSVCSFEPNTKTAKMAEKQKHCRLVFSSENVLDYLHSLNDENDTDFNNNSLLQPSWTYGNQTFSLSHMDSCYVKLKPACVLNATDVTRSTVLCENDPKPRTPKAIQSKPKQTKVRSKCDSCEKDFKTSGHLRRHALVHRGKNELPCFMTSPNWASQVAKAKAAIRGMFLEVISLQNC